MGSLRCRVTYSYTSPLGINEPSQVPHSQGSSGSPELININKIVVVANILFFLANGPPFWAMMVHWFFDRLMIIIRLIFTETGFSIWY